MPVSSVEIFSPIPIPASPVLIVRSDVETLELDKFDRPKWASAIGRDRYGLWAEFTVNAEVPVQPEPQKAASGSKRKNTKVEPPPLTTKVSVVQRMRWIPPGHFLMGSRENYKLSLSNEMPEHEVIFSHGYWLFDTPVTQQLWKAVMNTNPSHFFSDEQNARRPASWAVGRIPVSVEVRAIPIYIEKENVRRPIEQVSWEDCQSFIDTINQSEVGRAGLKLTLPTEAEWEYACRAGTTTSYSFGDEISPELANYWNDDTNMPEISDVAKYPANPWGLYDMHGNVWEWCFDWYSERYYSDSVAMDPVGPQQGLERVLRGGSWINPAQQSRSAQRNFNGPDYLSPDVGFRCAQVHSEAATARQQTERVNE